MKLRITIAILVLLFSFTNAFALVDKQQILNDIIKSINEQPEHWIDGGHIFSFFKSIKKAKLMRAELFPELEADVSLAYDIHGRSIYVHVEDPFKHHFEGKQLKAVVQAIRIFKLKVLQKQVGHLLKDEKKIMPKEKEEQNTNGSLKKL